MDLYNTVQFRKEVNGNLYIFTMPSNAPIGEAYDAILESLQHLVKVSQENAKKLVRQMPEPDKSSDKEEPDKSEIL